MESEVELYLFDYHRYRFEVVPALVTLVRTATPAPWIVELLHEPGGGVLRPWARTVLDRLAHNPTDLALGCAYLGDDLRFAGAARHECWPGPPSRPCHSQRCPQRAHCPLHQAMPPEVRAAVAALFLAATTRCRLGTPRRLQAGLGALGLDQLPDRERLDPTARASVSHLLAALRLRGAVIGCPTDDPGDAHGAGGAGAGGGGAGGGGAGAGVDRHAAVHGWLTAEESTELAERLENTGSTIQTVAATAARSGHGILCVGVPGTRWAASTGMAQESPASR